MQPRSQAQLPNPRRSGELTSVGGAELTRGIAPPLPGTHAYTSNPLEQEEERRRRLEVARASQCLLRVRWD